MAKRIFVAILIIICAFGAGTAISQQDKSGQDPGYAELLARISQLTEAQSRILQKLDAVIASQQKILSELDVIKIRASRR
jgi:hypothetical protein